MIGGGLLRRIGAKVLGRVVNRVQDGLGARIGARLGEGLGSTTRPLDASQPAVVKAWEPPPWLDIILRLLRLVLDRFAPR